MNRSSFKKVVNLPNRLIKYHQCACTQEKQDQPALFRSLLEIINTGHVQVRQRMSCGESKQRISLIAINNGPPTLYSARLLNNRSIFRAEVYTQSPRTKPAHELELAASALYDLQHYSNTYFPLRVYRVSQRWHCEKLFGARFFFSFHLVNADRKKLSVDQET